MDLNYLYHRHGTSLLMAERATCDASRSAHQLLASGYADRISEARRAQAGHA